MSELRGAHLHFDCVSGAAGDMTLGAVIDLGVPEEVIRDALDRLGVGGDRLLVARTVRGGVAAVDVKVRVDEHEHDHEHDEHGPHDHDHGHHEHHEHEHRDHGHHDHGHHEHHDHGHHGHAHRHYRDIKAMILAADLQPEIVRRALDMFDRVARAEAAIHGSTVDEVAFHEVGAIDSIVDIVGTAAALAWLRPESVTAASVAVGHGQVRCAHGIMPVPAPATIEILREVGGVARSGGIARELCTPTGAAILASAVTGWAPMPAMTPIAVGYGAGDADLPDRPNVLRITAGRRVGKPAGRGSGQPGIHDPVLCIEANIDDMSPEICEHALAQVFEAGAVDAWWSPIVMKKGRPALLLSALAPEAAADAVIETILRETTTIGVRFAPRSRRVLAREVVEVDTPYGRLPVKVARDGDVVVNIAPEYEPCREAATRQGVALKRVLAAAIAGGHRAVAALADGGPEHGEPGGPSRQ